MTRHVLFGLIKLLMLSVPFLSMAIMILSLWGIMGKATYTDLDDSLQGAAVGTKIEATNYRVNETKPIERCPGERKNPDSGTEETKPIPEGIDWQQVV
ncbi:MAG: hypothetical protein ACU841_06810 [Gammaproteobacteria bacterium]